MKLNTGRWFRAYSHSLTLTNGNEEFRASGIIVPQEQDKGFYDYPQTSPTGMVSYSKYIAYFVFIGGTPSGEPTQIIDECAAYTIERMEFIALMNCWRAVLREASDE